MLSSDLVKTSSLATFHFYNKIFHQFNIKT